MSKDIRSFFTVKKPPKPKIQDPDDDIIPESPDVHVKNKKKDTKKRRVIKDSDSEDEIFSSKKKKNVKDTSNEKNKAKPPKSTLKEVKAVDIFGSGPIKRTEPLVKKQKKTEIGIHSDEELEKSLLEIDNKELDSIVDEKDSEKPTDIQQPCTSKDLSTDDKKKNVINKKETKNSHTDSKKDVSKDCKTISEDTNKESKADSSKQEKKNKHADDTKSKVDVIRSKSKDENVSPKEPKKVKPESNKIGIKEQAKLDNKRKFSEFVDNEADSLQNSKKKKLNGNTSESKDSTADDGNDLSIAEDHDTQNKSKRDYNKSLNESVLTDEERYERKRQSAALYQKYLNRSGPKQLGSKQIPEGKPDCLKDCAFVLTGVLDSFEKDEIAEVITKYGGCVKSGVSKKVTHVLAGEDAGPAKLAKAQDFGIKIINEDEFLKMIVDLSQSSSKKETKKEIKKEKSPKPSAKRENTPKLEIKKEKKTPIKISSKDKISKDKSDDVVRKSKTDHSDKKSNESKSTVDVKAESKNREKSKSPRKAKEDTNDSTKETKSKETTKSNLNGTTKTDYAYMWVDKHKPQFTKNIIGQHGEASNVKKLMNWLTKWYVNRKAKLPKPSPWAKNDDGGYFKAALLSGPPGVGKTTTVALVCKELGFDMVEFNASDTRNKTLIKEQIGELLTTTSLSAYAKGDTGKQAVTKKHVLVMDEVDGMAGNEDRGGLQELISLIKSTSVPIICMCNDRNSQKMRSLVNYCYDLRFNRPRVEQIKSAMLSICCKERIKIPQDVLSELIVSANQDVRQTLNLLSMWAADPNIADTERLRRDASVAKKDVKLGPWEAIRKVFSAEDHKKMTIGDKSDLFFYDYSLAPLFVQENYLQVAPHCPKHEVLQRISAAADSISLGDLVDARIRRSQAWSMLPVQAMYSSVIPGHAMSGHLTGQIQFPGWLGKNSRATKMHRLCQEIHAHTRLSTTGSKSSIFLDYCTHLRDAIVNPLIKEKADGIDHSLNVLESYHLLREDLDSLVELSLWPTQRNPTVLIDAKVKAAMTRTYNKKASALPYAPGPVKRGRAKESEENGEEEENEEEEQDSDPENDAMIKKKKDKAEKPSTSKGAGSKQAGKEKKK